MLRHPHRHLHLLLRIRHHCLVRGGWAKAAGTLDAAVKVAGSEAWRPRVAATPEGCASAVLGRLPGCEVLPFIPRLLMVAAAVSATTSSTLPSRLAARLDLAALPSALLVRGSLAPAAGAFYTAGHVASRPQ